MPDRSAFVAFAFTINFIVGAGVLGLPYAFSKAGFLLGVCFLAIVSAIAVVTMNFLVEAVARGQAWQQYSSEGSNADPLLPKASDAHDYKSFHDAEAVNVGTNVPSFHIGTTNIEVNELCKIFIGDWAARVYEFSIFAYVFGSLWLYAIIFASSMSTAIAVPGLTESMVCDVQHEDVETPECLFSYRIWLAVFVFISTAMSSTELKSQQCLQVSLTCLAVCGIFTIIITTLVLIFSSAVGPPPNVGNYQTVEFGGFATLCSAAMFSQSCHFGIPSLLQLMNDKKDSKYVFSCAIATTYLCYCVLGSVTAIHFGTETENLITLNFSELTKEFTAPFAYVIQYFVVCFPVILVTAAYPLNGTALANNLMRGFVSKPDEVSRATKLAFRFIATVPPLVCAFFVPDASTVLTVTGFFAFVLTFWAPAILLLVSKKMCIDRWGQEAARTPYTWFLTKDCNAYIILVFSFGAFVFAFVQAIHPIKL